MKEKKTRQRGLDILIRMENRPLLHHSHDARTMTTQGHLFSMDRDSFVNDLFNDPKASRGAIGDRGAND